MAFFLHRRKEALSSGTFLQFLREVWWMNRFPEGSYLSNPGASAALVKNVRHALFRNWRAGSGTAKSIDEKTITDLILFPERQNL